MKRTTNFPSALAGVAVILATASCVFAEQLGPLEDFDNGGAIEYVSVTEFSETDDPPLFAPGANAPEVLVNKLDFDPSFGSTISGAQGIDLTEGQLNITFEMLPGSGVTAFSFMESGTFSFFPSSNATAATSVGYGLNVSLTVLEIDGVPVAETFSVSENDAEEVNATQVPTPALGNPWDLSIFLDLGPELDEREIDFEYGVTKGEIVIENTLASSSEAGTQSFIDKTDFMINPFGDLEPFEVLVPEPMTATLLAIGLATATLRRR